MSVNLNDTARFYNFKNEEQIGRDMGGGGKFCDIDMSVSRGEQVNRPQGLLEISCVSKS